MKQMRAIFLVSLKNRLRDLSELRQYATSVVPYRELRLTNDSIDCEWYFEVDNG
jgi:hypothetical protein